MRLVQDVSLGSGVAAYRSLPTTENTEDIHKERAVPESFRIAIELSL